MKNIYKSLLIGILLFPMSSFGYVIYNSSGGAANCLFREVIERHIGTNHYLNCKDPGATECNWTLPPPFSDFGFVEDYRDRALEHIQKDGILSGKFVTDHGNLVVWSASDDQYEIIIYSVDETKALGI